MSNQTQPQPPSTNPPGTNPNVNPNQNQNIAQTLAGLSSINLQQLQLKFPQLLTDLEKNLPEDQRNEVFRNKMMSFMRNTSNSNNNNNNQGGQQGGQGQVGQNQGGQQRRRGQSNGTNLQQQPQQQMQQQNVQIQPQQNVQMQQMQQLQQNGQIQQNQISQPQQQPQQSQPQQQQQLQPPQSKPSPMMQQQNMMNQQPQPQQQQQMQPQQQMQQQQQAQMQQQQQAQMQQQQVQMQPQQQNPQGQQQMSNPNQATYQDQMRLQQHTQQQQHLAAMMEKSQRFHPVQQQQAGPSGQQQQQVPQLQTPQQQQQQSMPPPISHPTPASIAAASPQNHVHSSPQMVRQSPVSNGGRNVLGMNGIKTLVEHFPKLLELKRTGKLGLEQEKLFDAFISSPEGRNHLEQYQAHHARTLVENGLANPVGLPHGVQQPQQTPMMNGMQLPLAAQQQMAALQHHQQQQQQQQGFPQPAHAALQAQIQQQYPGGVQQMIVNQQQQQGQQGQQMQSAQLTQQQMHQISLQRLAAAQAQAAQQAQQQIQNQNQGQVQGRTPMQNHTQLPNNVNLNQAQLLARAQSQMQQQQQQPQNQMNGQQYQDLQGQQQQQQQQQQQPNFGSPRPPAPQNKVMQQLHVNIEAAVSQMPVEKQSSIRTVLTRLAYMNDQQREIAFKQNEPYRGLWGQVVGYSQAAALQQVARQAQVLQSQAIQATPNQVQGMVQPPSQGVSSPHMGIQQNLNGAGPSTPNMQSRPNASTPNYPTQSNVPNLHIPANKQRNLTQAQVQVQQGQTPNSQNTSSPQMRPPIPQPTQAQLQAQAQATQAQAGLIQRMINSGIPVAQAVQNVAQARQQQQQQQLGLINGQQNGIQYQNQISNQINGIPNQMNNNGNGNGGGGGSNITPEMIISQIDQQNGNINGINRPTMRMNGNGEQIRQSSEINLNNIQNLDKSLSLLSKAKFEPTTETDLLLKEKLNKFQNSIKASGRSTMSINRVLGEVTLEKMPENLKLILDESSEIDNQIENKDNDLSLGGLTSLGESSTSNSNSGYSIGLQGGKKRKINDLAEGIDKALSVDSDVESLMLQFADEHNDIVSQISCSLAKHRKSDTIDRKDVQLAYETIFGRGIPGFSSDSIRLDQARSSRVRPLNPQRLMKLKLVNEAKANWRKEREKKDEDENKEIPAVVITNETKEGDLVNGNQDKENNIPNGTPVNSTSTTNGMIVPPPSMSSGGINIGGAGLGEGVPVVV